jgi:hypothetical protein
MRFSPFTWVQNDDPTARIRGPFGRLTQRGIDPDQIARGAMKVPGKQSEIARGQCLHLQHCRRLAADAAKALAASGGRCGAG